MLVVSPCSGITAVASRCKGEGLAEEDFVAFVVGSVEAVDAKNAGLVYCARPKITLVSY